MYIFKYLLLKQFCWRSNIKPQFYSVSSPDEKPRSSSKIQLTPQYRLADTPLLRTLFITDKIQIQLFD